MLAFFTLQNYYFFAKKPKNPVKSYTTLYKYYSFKYYFRTSVIFRFIFEHSGGCNKPSVCEYEF